MGDGNNVEINKDNINHNNNNPRFGFSVRLLSTGGRTGFYGQFFVFVYTMLDSVKLLNDLTQAYYDTRRNKRNTTTALNFEKNREANVFNIRRDMINGEYKISPSICFVIKDPVQREIFAADFRDRIVHHLIYNYMYKIFDNRFIYDSYSCRIGKGTHLGVRRIDHFIRSCSQNYTRDCYILKLDIQGFFMHINKNILFDKVQNMLVKEKEQLTVDYDFIEGIVHQVIFHNPVQNCIIKGKKSDRNGLPPDKSLFYSPQDTGLAIGNLTSQLFANIYLDSLDKYIKCKLGCRYYGRYVDDFLIIHQDKDFLKSIIPQIEKYLKTEFKLILHPHKRYLQHCSKGVQFLGEYIKPYRIYIRKRTVGNFYKKVQEINKSEVFDKEIAQSIINSYLGIFNHYKTYKIRKKVISNFSSKFRSQFCFTKSYKKIIPNN